jgi:hypothetical protein
MRTRLRVAMSAYASTRQNQLEDLKFVAGSPDNNWQWPADVIKMRGSAQGQTINARPCLTINKLPQHVKQVTNDQRQNRPSGKVIPVDDMADVEMAEVLDGIVRHIEYLSDADVAYDTACENQVVHGEGYIRLLTEYCDETSFDQDIKIGRVRNPFSVYMDPMIQDPCGADAEYCFITDEIDKDEYHRLYPKAAPVSSIISQGVGDSDLSQWVGEMTVRIAEYFYYEHKSATLNLYPNGQAFFQDDPQDKMMRQMGLRPTRQRKVDRKQVKWVKTNGFEVLEERDWPGQYIPVVRVIGNEYEVDGDVQISGLVRNAKDAQRLYNYWVSQEAEMLALAPKAPFIGYGGQFEGYEHQWKTANVNNWPYLEVNPDATDGQGAPLPLPQRSTPPMAQTGLIQAKMGASDDLKSTTGQYDPSLGASSNERSGRAILARQQQSNTGTFHYVDNLARAVRYITRQIIDLVPKIYDTRRIARIIGIDGEVTQAEIDPSQQQAVTKMMDEQGIIIKKIYNPSIGKYDVKVTTGPSYMTKRQESMEAMGQILQGNPQLWMAAGDLFVKNMDWPGAQELAARLKKMIDPKLLQDDDDPAIQAANQQIEALNGQIQQMMGLLQNVNQSMEAQDLAIKSQANDIKAYEAETRRLQAMSAAMSPEQVQEVVIQTLRDVMDLGNLAPMPQNFMPEPPQDPMMQQEQMPVDPMMLGPQEGLPQ